MAGSKQALGILNEYGKSKPRVWLEYGWSMARVCLRQLKVESLKFKDSLNFLRYAVCVILMMVVGVSEMKGATVTYHIINLGRLDDSGQLTSTRTEALQFTVTGESVTVGVPDKYKSPLATNWKYYKDGEFTYTEGTKSYTFPESTTLVEGTDVLSDGDHVYVTYELDEDKFREVGIYNRGIYKIKFPNDYYLMQDTWNNNGTIEVNTNPGTDPTTNTNKYLWKFNIIDPYQITVQSLSDSYQDWYLCSKGGNFGDIRLNETISGAKATSVWVFGLLNGGTTDTYRLVVTDGFKKTKNENNCDDFGHGYLNSNYKKNSNYKTTYQQYNKNSYSNCDLTFVPLTKTYIIVNNSGETIVQATTTDYPLEVPDVIKSPLATYNYYSDAACTHALSTVGTTTTIYVRYSATDVLNLNGEVYYNISVGSTNYLYADGTTLNSEATTANNANDTHKWTLNGNDPYQITIKNLGNSKEITYDVSGGEAVPTLSGTGSKFFLHEGTNGKYEVVAITNNDFSTTDYYTLGMASSTLKLYSKTNYPLGEAEVQTSFEPSYASITVDPVANTLTYDGSGHELVTAGTASNGTMQYRLGDTGDYSTTIPTATNAGTYSVYYKAKGSLGYADLVAAEPIEVTIAQKSVTVSGITASNKAYDGNTIATFDYSDVTLAGKVESDNLSVTATGTFSDKTIGTNKTVTISNLALAGDDAGNYVLAGSGQQSSATADITTAIITVSGITAENKTYDGTTAVTLVYTGVTLSGKVDNEDLTISATGAFVDANAETNKTVIISNLILSGNDVSNYALAGSGQQTSTTATIIKKDLTITADGATKVYDGSALTKNSYTNTALATGDAITNVTVTGSQTVVGSSNNVPSAVVIMHGENNVTASYNITLENGTLTVTQKALTIIAGSDTKVYDGTALTNSTYTTDPNHDLATGDAITSVTFTGSQTAVGSSSNVPSAAVIKNGSNETVTACYNITYTNGTLEVTRASVTVTADDASKTYGDAEPTSFTATVSGLVNNESESLISYTISRATGENVGEYAITPAAGDTPPDNYTVSYVAGTFTITPKTLGDGTRTSSGITITMEKDGDEYVVTAKDGETTLSKNTDYTLSEFVDDVVTITGIGNYTGSAKLVYANATFATPDNSSEYAAVYMSSLDVLAPADVKVYVVKKVSPTMGTVTISEINYIPKGVPVLLVADNDQTGFAASPITESTTLISDAVRNSNLLRVAPTGGVTVANTEAYMFYKGEFVLSLAGTMSAGKFFLYNPNYTASSSGGGGSVKRLVIVIDDEPTGMGGIADDGNTEVRNAAWYSLDGQKLKGRPNRKGLYITKGQKVVVN